jgi:drug/metabolite transporter (DMT)-like permease
MRTSAPKKVTWWIGLILLIVGAVLAILPQFVPSIPYTFIGVWLLFFSALLYAIATAVKGL